MVHLLIKLQPYGSIISLEKHKRANTETQPKILYFKKVTKYGIFCFINYLDKY
jgi:hypothetical protein